MNQEPSGTLSEPLPLFLEKWDPSAGRNGMPRDHWKYEVYLNGDRQPLACKADAKLGMIELAVMDGQIYNVLAGKRVAATGQVEIRLKAAFREEPGDEPDEVGEL